MSLIHIHKHRYNVRMFIQKGQFICWDWNVSLDVWERDNKVPALPTSLSLLSTFLLEKLQLIWAVKAINDIALHATSLDDSLK